MDHQLLIVQGRSITETIKLADGVTTVGRQDDCQLRIKSSQVSRKHCELFEKKGLLLVKDLGSSNGTFVNGKRIQGQRVLEPGDELTIGGVKLRVAKVGEPVPPPKEKPAKKPGDTAIVEMVATEAAGGEDEFEIEFDAEPSAADGVGVGVGAAPSEPAPAAAEKAAAPAAPPEAKKEPEPAPAAGHDSPLADDAIADFLMDIKLDED
jgi:predicted component of type VI protein secretion system